MTKSVRDPSLSDAPFLKRYGANLGQMIMGRLPNSASSLFISAIPVVGAFYELYNIYTAITEKNNAIDEQNAIALFEREKYDLQLRIQQSANYLASSAILEDGRQYVGDLENAFLKAGVSLRSGTGAMQLEKIKNSFRKRAMLAHQGLL